MIANAKIRKVVQLLEEGKLSQRQIAEITGVSRGSVGAIARGSRTTPAPEPYDYDEETRFIPPSGVPTRCPCCGRLVQKPCLACQIWRMRTRTVTNGGVPTVQVTCER